VKPFGYHGFVALNSSKKSHAKSTALSHHIQGGKAMKGSIPRQFIDDLLTKSNIVDVINARVKLKKAGSSLLSVSSRKNTFFHGQ